MGQGDRVRRHQAAVTRRLMAYQLPQMRSLNCACLRNPSVLRTRIRAPNLRCRSAALCVERFFLLSSAAFRRSGRVPSWVAPRDLYCHSACRPRAPLFRSRLISILTALYRSRSGFCSRCWKDDSVRPMATRQQRLDAFVHEGDPPIGEPLELLCEDHVGTYVIPFLCRWTGVDWQSANTGERIQTTVIGWNAPTARK